MSQEHQDPPPVAGVHLVKTTSREEDSLASDCVDILQAGLRGSTDTDTGGVEETYLTTLEKDEAARIEREWLQAVAHRCRDRLHWLDKRRGMRVVELGDRDGWRFSVYDREGRPFEVEISFSSIAQVAAIQRRAARSNFQKTLDHVCDQLRDARVAYHVRLSQARTEIH